MKIMPIRVLVLTALVFPVVSTFGCTSHRGRLLDEVELSTGLRVVLSEQVHADFFGRRHSLEILIIDGEDSTSHSIDLAEIPRGSYALTVLPDNKSVAVVARSSSQTVCRVHLATGDLLLGDTENPK